MCICVCVHSYLEIFIYIYTHNNSVCCSCKCIFLLEGLTATSLELSTWHPINTSQSLSTLDVSTMNECLVTKSTFWFPWRKRAAVWSDNSAGGGCWELPGFLPGVWVQCNRSLSRAWTWHCNALTLHSPSDCCRKNCRSFDRFCLLQVKDQCSVDNTRQGDKLFFYSHQF